MKKSWKPSSPWLDRKVKRGFHGYPIATVAFYGPTAETATKIAVGIFKEENLEADPFERWFSQESDIRLDTVIGEQIAAFIKAQEVRSVLVTDGIIGCPHEEGTLTQCRMSDYNAPGDFPPVCVIRGGPHEFTTHFGVPEPADRTGCTVSSWPSIGLRSPSPRA